MERAPSTKAPLQAVAGVHQTVIWSQRVRDVDERGRRRLVARWTLTLACGHVVHRSAAFDAGGMPPRAPKRIRCACGEGARPRLP